MRRPQPPPQQTPPQPRVQPQEGLKPGIQRTPARQYDNAQRIRGSASSSKDKRSRPQQAAADDALLHVVERGQTRVLDVLHTVSTCSEDPCDGLLMSCSKKICIIGNYQPFLCVSQFIENDQRSLLMQQQHAARVEQGKFITTLLANGTALPAAMAAASDLFPIPELPPPRVDVREQRAREMEQPDTCRSFGTPPFSVFDVAMERSHLEHFIAPGFVQNGHVLAKL